MYLGVKKQYDLPHHNVFFAKDYKANVKNIFNNLKLSQDTSFYIQNASLTDPTLAPKGKSTLYVLIPVPNKKGKIDWKVEKDKVRENVLNLMETRAGLKDLRQNIEVEKIYTPDTWDDELNVFLGATFNLGHNLPQMLYFRPRNQFEEVDNVYLTGGGTHPGSGLPTIYESGRISANLICKKYGASYKDPLKTDRTELFK
jgi:phytoene desaturase